MRKKSIIPVTSNSNHLQNAFERTEFDVKNEQSLWPILKFFMGLLKIVQAKNEDSKKSGGSHKVHFNITLRVAEKWTER